MDKKADWSPSPQDGYVEHLEAENMRLRAREPEIVVTVVNEKGDILPVVGKELIGHLDNRYRFLVTVRA